MNDTVDVILVNRCNQSDEFRTVLPVKMRVRVLVIPMLAAASAHNDAADVSGDGCVTSLDALMILEAADREYGIVRR